MPTNDSSDALNAGLPEQPPVAKLSQEPHAASSGAALRPCQRHPQEQTRLSCTACGTAICPRCMVTTEVGFKCPGCIRQIASHMTDLRPGHLLLVLVLSILAGIGYGFVHPLLMGIGIFRLFGLPVLGFLLAFVLGQVAGRLIHRLIRFKVGRVLAWMALLGCLAGFMLSPMMLSALEMLAFLQEGAARAGESGGGLGGSTEFYVFGQMIQWLGAVFFYRGLSQAFSFK